MSIGACPQFLLAVTYEGWLLFYNFTHAGYGSGFSAILLLFGVYGALLKLPTLTV